ncbi:MAG: methyltransferase [Clostridia bacterium]|nr:methyltransferase [Clostridia bacterium]
MTDFTFESIGGGLSVAVNDSCRVSQDGLLLADFAAPLSSDRACDLGTGNGILPLRWCRREPPVHITAVERERDPFALLCAGIEKHDLSARITPLCCDWNDEAAMPSAHSMTLVTCNPPYFPFAGSRPSPDPVRDAARREDSPDLLARLCASAARLLDDDGRFCLCHRPERLADVLASLREAGLTPVKLQFVQSQEATAPWLFLCEAKRRGVLRVLPPLITARRGTHTAVYKRLYR